MHSTSVLRQPSGNLAQSLARFTLDLQLAAIPDTVWNKSVHHIVDAIGLAFASHNFPFAKAGLAGIRAAGAAGDSTVIGGGDKLSPRDAAFANGYLMHGLDFDDTHPASIVHPTVACLPAALAIAEARDMSWGELITAYAAGMETAIRLGRAVKGGFHHVGFHATGIVSHFSAAIVAGKLLELSLDQLVSAQGIAGSTTSGIQVFLENGAWTKRMHPGWGALSGITAAHMAQAGFAGPDRPYEGKFGLFDTHLQALAGEVDADSIAEGLGRQWTLLDTSIKPYPVCHFIHGCAEAALQLREQTGSIDRIAGITCELPAATLAIVAEPAAAKRVPKSDYEAKFSAQFVIAACLLRGRFTLAELSDESLRDPDILMLAAKVDCVAETESQFPKYFSGAVSVRLVDGGTLRVKVPINLGSGERALSLTEIVAKFRGNASIGLPASRVDAALDTLLGASRDTPVRSITRALA
ncbi:2-methylcitrate dehydratase PrpD [Paraburkholderia fungorum]|uniref:2-methylcitrate dehydratase PrpD n=1 Tax=Paraburkholderia fungorum TaxID=134537 RepID=A0A1H1JE23_9BURK|nr:MmgE/PrpD family protein [Paraburkholderia fungorum]SDR48195.1 2-methylcitrate dehydratase PrpD [Paraburkholderia fungorum]